MIDLPEIPDISSVEATLHKAQGLRDAASHRLKETQQEIADLGDEELVLDQVSNLFRTLIDKEVLAGVTAVEKLQTEGLQAVFDDQDLEVSAQVDLQRGKVSVNLKTSQRHGDGTVTEGASEDAFGGAITTAQSVLMRVIVMLRRGMRPLLLLDETLPALDSNYAANMGKFLGILCDRLGMDILLVTHNPVLVDAAQRSYKISKKNGIAHFQLTKAGRKHESGKHSPPTDQTGQMASLEESPR